MSRTTKDPRTDNWVGAGRIEGGDDIRFDWGTPPQSAESRRYLRRHANKARRRNDRAVIKEQDNE
jgi:hypothetical protein